LDIRSIDRVPAFTTKDGSEIRELLAHRNSCIEKQSLAEAVHQITNVGREELKFLCCCAPAYEDEDTALIGG
jgi:hypothetical protein